MSVRTKQYKIYTELAPIYDYVMRHVNYRKWAEYVSTLFQFVGVEVNTILDVACGTGTLGLILNNMGFNVCGFDYSPDMVLQGKGREMFSCHGMRPGKIYRLNKDTLNPSPQGSFKKADNSV